MRQKTNHILIGAFVLSGGALGVLAGVLLGAGALNREELIAETYLEESVTGLERGAHVRFRGVKIGSVTEIGYTSLEYDSDKPYVLVRFALRPTGENQTLEEFEQVLLTRLGEGLRCRLAAVSLTGSLYVEADLYPDAEKNYPPLEIDFAPKHRYVPSIPSTIAQLGDSVDSILRKVDDLDLEGTVEDLRSTLRATRDAIAGIDVPALADSADRTLAQVRESVARLEEKGVAVLDELGAAIEPEGVRALVTSIRELAESLEPTRAQLDRFLADAGGALGEVRDALGARRRELEQIFESTRRLATSFANLASTLESYPSLMLLGNPPPRTAR